MFIGGKAQRCYVRTQQFNGIAQLIRRQKCTSKDYPRVRKLVRNSAYLSNHPTQSLPEKASIDEAFMDLTRPVRQIMLERYPYLAHVPDGAALGLDTPLPPPPQVSWDGLGTLIPIDPSQEPNEENITPSTWHDVALSIAAESMEMVRQQINAKLGYTTSAVHLFAILSDVKADLLCRVLQEINFWQR
jgi:nucleotidyltransferase/DNA polymerase involved in DNA repair